MSRRLRGAPMDEVRICLIGGGRAGLVHGRNYAAHLPGARLVAVVDPVEAVRIVAAGELGVSAHFASLEEALERAAFEAVSIATPTHTHHALTSTAARAGKHVFCEKPMALTVEEAVEMLKATERAGVILQMGFMRRFDEEFLQAEALIAEGALGRLRLVRSTTRGPGLPPPWALDPAKGIGLVAEVNSHDFDAVRWLTRSEFRQVFAQAGTHRASEVQALHPDFYDTIVLSCQLEDGTLGVIEGAYRVEYGYDARMELLGTEGLLTVGAVAAGTVHRATREGEVVQGAFRSWRDRHRGGYLEEDRHFVACVREGRRPRVTGVDGLRALEAVLAATRSLRSGQPEPVQRVPLAEVRP